MVIADSGFWIALIDRGDKDHVTAVKTLEVLNEPIITTSAVLTETCHLLLHRFGFFVLNRFMAYIVKLGVRIGELSEEDLPRIAKLMLKYKDSQMDFADATLVVLAEDFGEGRILSTDRNDFQRYRWKNNRVFVNLLESH